MVAVAFVVHLAARDRLGALPGPTPVVSSGAADFPAARPALDLVVLVRDSDGASLAGVTVGVLSTTGPFPETYALNDDRGVERRARTDATGRAVLAAFATAPDGRAGFAIAWSQDVERSQQAGGLEVRVDALGRLEGRLLGLPAAELARARVRAHALTGKNPHSTTDGRSFETLVVDAAFVFEGLPAGRWTLELVDPAGARIDLPPLELGDAELENSLDPLEVAVAAGETTWVDLALVRGGTLAGVVRTTEGEPIAGALVRATFAPRNSNYPDGYVLHGANVWRFDSARGTESEHPISHPRTRTDGRYELTGLAPGAHRLEVVVPGRVYDRREAVRVEAGTRTELGHVLSLAGAIQGIARGGGYLGVARPGEEGARMIAILPGDGLFTFPGLEAGEWSVVRYHSDTRIRPVPVVTVTVEAGRTTWVDVDREGTLPLRIAGRVLDANGPVAGARVRLSRVVHVTDASRSSSRSPGRGGSRSRSRPAS